MEDTGAENVQRLPVRLGLVEQLGALLLQLDELQVQLRLLFNYVETMVLGALAQELALDRLTKVSPDGHQALVHALAGHLALAAERHGTQSELFRGGVHEILHVVVHEPRREADVLLLASQSDGLQLEFAQELVEAPVAEHLPVVFEQQLVVVDGFQVVQAGIQLHAFGEQRVTLEMLNTGGILK